LTRLDDAEARSRLGAARVGRLATVTPEGRPHVVPVCFALDGDVVYSAVDDKPKATRSLTRLDNVRASPGAALLVDHYDEDWQRLWWVRADGEARVLEESAPEHRRAAELLRGKYDQYRDHRLGSVIALHVQSWRSWAATPPAVGAVGWTAFAELSHHVEELALARAGDGTGEAEAAAELAALAFSQREAVALALAYAFRRQRDAPTDPAVAGAIRLLAAALRHPAGHAAG
jgi:PPOX class probable F420-dependent enzyme